MKNPVARGRITTLAHVGKDGALCRPGPRAAGGTNTQGRANYGACCAAERGAGRRSAPSTKGIGSGQARDEIVRFCGTEI